ncbi:MAG: divergent polysaccharide deacetylase family protein, partial [Deltaproteobacteria bacterium]
MPPAPKKKKPSKRGRKKGFLFFLLLSFLVVLTLGATLYFLFIGPGDKLAKKRLHLQYEQSPAIGEFTLPPVKTAPSPAKIPAAQPGTCLMAIVIDDMGYQKAMGRKFLAIDLPLSFSFLPHAPFTRILMREAKNRQRDILLHIPLEPLDSSLVLGPGALLTTMSAASMTRVFNEDLDLVSFAIGVNNHMGSKFTEDRAAMTTLLAAVKKHDLFFLDSLTSANSIGFELAERMKIPAARRNVFL